MLKEIEEEKRRAVDEHIQKELIKNLSANYIQNRIRQYLAFVRVYNLRKEKFITKINNNATKI